MKIISKYKDFYDNTVADHSGYNWIRQTKEFIIDITKKEEVLSYDSASFLTKLWSNRLRLPLESTTSANILLLGYCGEIIPLFVIYEDSKTMCENEYIYRHLVRYSNSNVLSAHLSYNEYEVNRRKVYNNDDLSFDLFLRKNNYRYYYGSNKRNIKVDDLCINWKGEFLNKKSVDNLFLDLKTPIFIVTIDRNSKFPKLILNPQLNMYGVHKLFSGYKVYQDIEQYLTNDLVSCNMSPCIMTNELKRDAHGFNNVSFKNEKGHKRGRI